MPLVGSHQQGAFSTPQNGQPTDASVVLSNDNATRTTTNAHDADATIHIQSSVLASRPAAGTAQRVWITTDGLRAYVDSGSVWNELDYLSKTAGGTVAGAVTLSASLTAAAASFSGALSTSSASLTVSGGANPYLKLNDGTGDGFVQVVSGDINLTPRTGKNVTVTGGVTVSSGVTISANGLTVSSGTTAVQALTATGITSSGIVSAVSTTPFTSSNAGSPTTGHQVLTSTGSTTAAVFCSFANSGASQLFGIESSAGGVLYAGTSAYSAVFGTSSARSLHLVTNNAVRLTIDSAGATTLAGGLTVSAGGLSVTGVSTFLNQINASGGISGALIGNASTATALQTARTINGTSFDGTANITVTAAAGTLTGTTLAATVTASSLTSVGVLASPHMTSPVVDSGGLTVTAGGIAVTGGHLIVQKQGMFGAWDGSGDGFSLHVSKDTAGTATGGAQTLPANPAGFLTWLLGATTIKVPYYNN